MSAPDSTFNMVGAIMAYEAGESTEEEVITLFQHLVDTRDAWTLQGSYGRMAMNLIEAGLVTKKEKDSCKR